MFFYLSKILWLLIQPSNLLLLLVVGGVLALLLGHARAAAWLLGPTAVAFLLVGILPVGQWLILPLEDRFPRPEGPLGRVDGVIVLGGGVEVPIAEAREVVAFGETAERFTTLLELGRRYPDAKVLFTGGRGWGAPDDLSEADVMREFCRQHGFDESRFLFEGSARNTYQNAVNSKALVAPQPAERWLLVTSAYHMPRSVGVFRRVGWPVIAYPVDYRTRGELGLWSGFDVARRLTELDLAIKAWTGLVVYWLTGRTESLLPTP